MLVRRFLGLVVLSILSAISTGALARSIDAAITSSTRSPTEPEKAIREEVWRFGTAQISVRDAVKIVQERIAGARAVDVSFDGQADRSTYRIMIHRADAIREEIIDASTGVLVGEGSVTPVSALDAGDKSTLARFSAAGLDLSDVVPIAEQYGVGKAVSAGLGEDDGRLVFLVVLVVDGSLKLVSLDARRDRRRSPKGAAP